jgi:hypothetical protein
MMVMGLASPERACADTFTLNQTKLLALWDVFENPASAATGLGSKTISGDGVVYAGNLADTVGNPVSPFVQMGIGTNLNGSSSTGSGPTLGSVLGTTNLSTFDGFALQFRNVGSRPRSVGLFLNTGFTDPPYNEPNNFYQSGFVSLAPGDTGLLVLNFNALGVINRNHVTSIGFQIGGSVTTTPEDFQIRVAPIPEPASVWLGMIAAIGVGCTIATRRRQVAG